MPSRGKAVATQPLAYLQAHVSLQNLFADYLDLSLHAVQPGKLGMWYELYPPPPGLAAVQFEVYFKRLRPRYRAFEAAFARSRAARKAGEGAHLGLSFCTAPTGPLQMVTGNYLEAVPTAEELHRRYRSLAGRAPGPREELFEAYARAVLAAPQLGPEARRALGTAVEAAARWYGGQAGPSAGAIEALKPVLARDCPRRMERYVERRRERILWWAASAQGWASWDRRDFGSAQAPEAAIAFAFSHPPAAGLAEALVQTARLRQESFRLAVERQCIAGRALGEGSCWLLPLELRGARARTRLEALAREAAQEIGRRLGAAVTVGLSLPAAPERMPEALRQAEWALLMALQQGRPLLPYQGDAAARDPALDAFEAGQALQRAVLEGGPEDPVAARVALSGSVARTFPGRADLQRPLLLQAVLQCFEGLRQRGLDEAHWDLRRQEALRSLREARSPRELSQALGEVLDALGALARSPRSGASRLRVQGQRRALDEAAGSLDLAAAARRAGVSASRFSRLYREQDGEGFSAARQRRRLERAAILLGEAALPVWRVAQECGYRSASHFSQVFRARHGVSPSLYRRKALAKKQ
jgi:AraC-like DNA-binding protein